MKTHTITSDGGPSAYYDIPEKVQTLNDLIEHKSYAHWGGDSWHLANIFKAIWRWGIKSGVDKTYDARKIIYSAARLLMWYGGVDMLRNTLNDMLNDPQFQTKGEHND